MLDTDLEKFPGVSRSPRRPIRSPGGFGGREPPRRQPREGPPRAPKAREVAPIQAAVSLAQGDTLSVETFDVVQALLREARHEPERGIHIPKVNLDDAIVLTFIDGS